MPNPIYLSPPHLGCEEAGLVAEAIASNWIAPLGPHVDAFEREFADKLAAGSAAAVSSGTAAIHLALRLLGISTNDRVFVSSFTFIASVAPVLQLGATPVFIDSEPESWNMDPGLLEQALSDAAKANKLPKAVVLVHLYGQAANLDQICAACNRYGVPLVEDAAEALGSTYQGRATGTVGRFGAFSFNGNKIITTSGGGMLVGSSDTEILRAKKLAAQAREPALHYEHTEYGYNYRMSNILAAIGRGQLRVLDDRVDRRRRNFDSYAKRLSAIDGVRLMPEAPWGRSTRWLTCALVDPERFGATCHDIMTRLASHQIEARPLWKPMHMQPLFAGFLHYGRGVSDALYQRGICLPSGSSLVEDDVDRVVSCMLELGRR
jgi:dTDP-4-amino-4,6-dideoxygalactose transaminase